MRNKPSYYLLLYFILQSNFVSSQVRFNKMYDFHGYADGATVVQETNNGYLVIGAARDSATLIMGMGVLIIDKYGNEIDKRIQSFGQNHFTCGGSWFNSYDSTLFLVGTMTFPNSKIAGHLTRININGDTLFHKIIYDTTYNSQANAIYRNSDGTLMIAGSTDKTDTAVDAYLMKIDSVGNIIWEKEYVLLNTMEYGNSLEKTSAGDFIIGGFKYSSVLQNTLSRLLRVDSIGNIIWQLNYGISQYHNNSPFVKKGKNNSFLASTCFGYNYFSNNLYSKPNITYFDSLNNEIWFHEYYKDSALFVYVGNIIINNDSSAVVPSTLGNNFYSPFGIIHFDPRNGNLKYMRKLYNWDNIEFVFDMKTTIDSGFILVGNNYPFTYSQNFRVIKVDKFGCDTANCQIYDDVREIPQYFANDELMVFPNPASNKIYIDFKKVPVSPYFKTTVNVYDLTGKKVYSQTEKILQKLFEVNVSSLAPGSYIIETTHNGYGAGNGRFVKQ